jgi:hypothetical protein
MGLSPFLHADMGNLLWYTRSSFFISVELMENEVVPLANDAICISEGVYYGDKYKILASNEEDAR